MKSEKTNWNSEERDYFAVSEYNGVLKKYYNDGRIEVIEIESD